VTLAVTSETGLGLSGTAALARLLPAQFTSLVGDRAAFSLRARFGDRTVVDPLSIEIAAGTLTGMPLLAARKRLSRRVFAPMFRSSRDERSLTSRQIDQARGDLYAISDDLEFLKAQIARQGGAGGSNWQNANNSELNSLSFPPALRPNSARWAQTPAESVKTHAVGPARTRGRHDRGLEARPAVPLTQKDVLYIMERIAQAGAGFRSITESIDGG
jgi:hypothetical protein